MLTWESYRMISAYSLSFPLLSLHLRYITEASTLAGEKVLGSFNKDMTLSRMVLKRTHTHTHKNNTPRLTGRLYRVKTKLERDLKMTLD